MLGSLRAGPRALGLLDSVVEAHIEPRRAVFAIDLPANPPLRARLGRVLRAVVSSTRVIEELRDQEREIARGYEALVRSQRDFRHVLDSLPDGVVIHRRGAIVYANPTLLRTLGQSPTVELRGRTIEALLDPLEGGADALVGAEGEQAAPRDIACRRRDGTSVVLRLSPPRAVRFQDEPAELVVVRDVTEEQRLKEQLAAADRMASLGTLAAGIAHEINNPLAYVQLNLDLLRRDLASHDHPALGGAHLASMHEALEAAADGTGRVRAITRDLKEFSRPEPARARGPVDVHRTIESAIAMIDERLAARARLVRDYGEPPPAQASDARLTQVFLNVLVNAFEAFDETDERRNEVRVRTRGEAGRVIVEVVDNAAGMPPEVLGRVFEPFFTTKHAAKGTGLGLALSHRIVEQLGGRLDVESVPGEGTCFRLELPRGPVRIAGAAPMEPRHGSTPRGRRRS